MIIDGEYKVLGTFFILRIPHNKTLMYLTSNGTRVRLYGKGIEQPFHLSFLDIPPKIRHHLPHTCQTFGCTIHVIKS